MALHPNYILSFCFDVFLILLLVGVDLMQYMSSKIFHRLTQVE